MRSKVCFCSIFLGLMMALVPLGAGAQQASRLDAFAGYSYMHSNLLTSGKGVNLNGVDTNVAYNLKPWLGVVGDVSVYYAGNAGGTGTTLTVVPFLFGPRIYCRKHKQVTPFAQVLLGGAHAGGTMYTRALGAGHAAIGAENAFAFTAGAGMDWNFRPNYSVRLFQAEYAYTSFDNFQNNAQNNFRLSVGIVRHWGK